MIHETYDTPTCHKRIKGCIYIYGITRTVENALLICNCRLSCYFRKVEWNQLTNILKRSRECLLYTRNEPNCGLLIVDT